MGITFLYGKISKSMVQWQDSVKWRYFIMIDIHSHIMPGIDDGALDTYHTLEMARLAAESGVTNIVATPHCNIPGMFDNYFGKEYIDAFYTASQAIKDEGIPVKLHPGMEVFATYDLPDLIVNGKIMPLNQSRYILIEFAFDEEPEFADDLLKRVVEVGARPVIAHVERYKFVQEIPQIIYFWRRRGYVIQANKGSFLGRFGRKTEETAYSLLRHNLISVIASDAHSPYRRTPFMKNEYEHLRDIYDQRTVDLLFKKNPGQICKNQSIYKLEPIPFDMYG